MDVKKVKASIRQRLGQAFSRVKASPVVLKLISYIIKFSMGLILPEAFVLGAWSPFGLAYAAALGASEGSMIGIIGTLIGYFRVMTVGNGLKYIAICILIFTASFVFRDTKMMTKPWFMPLSASVCSAVIGFVFVMDADFAAMQVVFFLTEILLVCICTYAYQFYFNNRIKSTNYTSAEGTVFRAMSMVILIASILIPFDNFEIVLGATLGKSIAVFLVMTAGYYGSMGIGSLAGIIFGMAISIAQSSPVYCALYGFSVICACVFSKKGKILYAVVYLISNAAAMFYLTSGSEIGALYEAFFASVAFILFGEYLSGAVPSVNSFSGSVSNMPEEIKSFTRTRLESASKAFEQLHDLISEAFAEKPEKNTQNISCVFNHPAEQVCRACENSGACWEKEYISTKDALNNTVNAINKRGYIKHTDYPLYFRERCIHIKEFTDRVNREIIAFRYRAQYRKRIEENRKVVCAQYRDMSEIFDKLSKAETDRLVFLREETQRVRSVFEKAGKTALCYVYRDMPGRIVVQIEGENVFQGGEKTNALTDEISSSLGVHMYITNREGTYTLLRQVEPMQMDFGAKAYKKQKSDLSGDTGSIIKTEDGKMHIILSDGMGSGVFAARESARTVSLCESFLRAGIDTKASVSTINSALSIKNANTGVFTTLDVISTDLFSGECEIYKYGSAPTYIKRGGHVRRVVSKTLPVGVGSAPSTEKIKIKLYPGDVIVALTDGVADAYNDTWLVKLLSDLGKEPAKQIAEKIADTAAAKNGYTDDITVMAGSIII